MDKNILDWFSCGTCTDEMKWLQDLLFEIDLSKLDLQRGIYFLYLGEELQYIGQSIVMKKINGDCNYWERR